MRLEDTATWAEIHAQPDIWEAWAPELAARAADIAAWIEARAPREIWLCGAGTSAFVGDILAAAPPDRRVRSVATTDIVACPQDWLPSAADALIVQFGRSGDSSESVGLLDLLDAHAPRADRLHVTCNPDGALATRASAGAGQLRVLLLPEETHDAGFAMTSSFTTMLLSALACLGGIDPADALPALASEARALLPALAARPAPRPGRAIFLGSGALKGAARESALKVLELTAGRTVTQWDSPMGFRHGPKSAVDGDTAVFVLLHPDDHTRRFDRDVADEIAAQFPSAGVTTIGPGGDIPYRGTGSAGADAVLAYRGTGSAGADAVLAVLPAQVFAARWSADLGLPVDDPFQGRNLSRVVSGVTLYDWTP